MSVLQLLIYVTISLDDDITYLITLIDFCLSYVYSFTLHNVLYTFIKYIFCKMNKKEIKLLFKKETFV